METNTKVAKKTAHALNEQLHAEAESLLRAEGRIAKLRHDDDCLPESAMSTAINLLALTRDMVRKVDADYKERIKDIADPFKPFAVDRKQINGRLAEIEAALEADLKRLVAAGAIQSDGFTTAIGIRLSLVAKRELVVTDASAIPDEFLLPREKCIDMEKLRKHIEANEALAAASAAAGVAPAAVTDVHGVEMYTTYTFRTKVPEEVS